MTPELPLAENASGSDKNTKSTTEVLQRLGPDARGN
jgi:hypothetical protein